MTKLFSLPHTKRLQPHNDPELLNLVLLLRYGAVTTKPDQAPLLNNTTIATVLGITRDVVRTFLAYSKRMSLSPEGERGRKRGKLSLQHIQYLTADATLDDWAHLSLKERAIMFHRQFPELHVSPTLIRRVYHQFKISFKSIRRTKPPI
jgi:transposase